MIVLTIDCGTQSLRGLLYSAEGELIDKCQIEYEPYFSMEPGWAEQDPNIFWNALCNACQDIKRKNEKLFSLIKGVGITTQRDSMVNVDKNGIPLRPITTWLDQRKARPHYYPNPFVKLGLWLTNMYEPVMKVQTDAKCNWIMQNQPEIWSNTYKYLQTSGYLNYKLTGRFNDSIASQIGHIPFDYKKMEWSSKKEFNYIVCPIEYEKLPDLIEPGEILGKITKEASLQSGIPEGIPVIACGSDKGCETVGMGVIDEKMASLSFGTTATVQTTTRHYCEPLKYMPPYPAVIPGYYNPEVEIFRGFWMITWFKNEFAHKEIEEARQRGKATEEVLNELLKQSPPGSMGLVVQPYWSPSLKDPCAKGAIIGFGDIHNKAHIYRAVIEGLAYGLKDGLHKIERVCKCKVEKLAVSGGASQSDEICQISADVFNLPIVRGRTYETSGLGAAMVTCVGLKIYKSFDDAIKNMVRYDRIFEPNRENVELYNALFNRVYQKIYPALESIYQDIRDITDFPNKVD